MEIQNIREYPELLELVVKYHYPCWKDFYFYNNQIKSEKELLCKYKEWFVSTNLDENLYVLWLNDKLIGFISIGKTDIETYIKPDPQGIFIGSIYIIDKYRSQGYGSFLLREMIRRIKNKIYISVSESNLFSYYEKFGFQKIDTCWLGKTEYTIMEL